MSGYTKRLFVTEALAEIGVGSDYDVSAAQLISGCNKLDALMAEWDASGIHIGYPISVPASTDPEQETSVYPYAINAVVLNLAVRLAPAFGRQPMPDTKAAAKAAKDVVVLRMTQPQPMGFGDTMPAGAGNKPYQWGNGSPFLIPDADGIAVADEGELTFTD